MIRRVVSLFLVWGLAAGCGDDAASLDDYLPDLPKPTGEAQSVWAGDITSSSTEELIDGPASAGMVGDVFMRNSRGRYVIQAPTRVIGVVPQGGNLVDAVPLDGSGNDAAVDHFGELGLIYLVGRTCRHDTLEVLQDGSGGGAAVVQAIGKTDANDFINLRGMAVLSVPLEIDPDIEDNVDCATTYILEPDSDSLQVHVALFNPGELDIKGPVGMLNDSGGDVGSWYQGKGFERLGIDSLTSATDPAPTEYVVYQGPEVAYGLLPRHADETVTNSTFLIQGVSIILYGAEKLLDILNEDFWHLDLKAKKGASFRVDVSVGFDGADAEEAFLVGAGREVAEVSGTAKWATGGAAAAGARIALFTDEDNNGQLDADDPVVTYFDAGADGSFGGKVRPGNYLAKAEVKDQAASAVQEVTVGAGGLSGLDLTLPNPVKFDYEITDFDTGNPTPGKITVIGHHPADPDSRMFEKFDVKSGVVRMSFAVRGSTSVGQDPDQPFYLPPGTYRVFASRGTEWSVDSQVITVTAGDPDQDLAFSIRRVVDTPDYLSTEYHVHQVGSPDSPILNDARVRSAVAEGVELFCTSDHDYVADIQPVVEQLGVEAQVRIIPGLETTPFAYGHFNAWPINVDMNTPNRGAIDWAEGNEGYAMLPGEIFAEMRSKGAELVQVNHPRAGGGSISDFMQFFDRAGLSLDFDARVADSDLLRQPVPNEWLRLPETSIWDPSFNALEVWNGFSMTDSNEDGVREIDRLDYVLRDWFGFLTLGMDIVPLGNSDTHSTLKDPMGMPRTYVRVTDDTSNALSTGNAVDDVLDTLAGRGNTPRDVVVTNGPFIAVSIDGGSTAPLGSVIDASGSGSITFDITVTAPEWAQFDTFEVFANETMEVGGAADPSVLQPRFCFTSRTGLAETDTCALAQGGAQALTVNVEDLGDGFSRRVAVINLTVDATDIQNRSGATGTDAWFVFRVYGTRSIFPILMDGVLESANLDTLVSGSAGEQDAVLNGAGVPAAAFTAPIYVDFDGGGYTAVFTP